MMMGPTMGLESCLAHSNLLVIAVGFYSLTAGDDGDRSLTVICCADGRSLIASGTR